MDGGFSTENFGEMKGGTLIKNPNRRIPEGKAIEILNDCADVGVKAIQFTGGGEPTAHPDHIDIFDCAKLLGLKVGLVTNGLVMREPGVLANMDWVRISLDAGFADTYEKIRESKSFDKVLSNIKALVSFDTPCVIGIGFVVTRENWQEISRACEIAENLGVEYVRLSAMFSEEGSKYYVGLTSMIEESILEAKEQLTGSCKIVDLIIIRIHKGSSKTRFDDPFISPPNNNPFRLWKRCLPHRPHKTHLCPFVEDGTVFVSLGLHNFHKPLMPVLYHRHALCNRERFLPFRISEYRSEIGLNHVLSDVEILEHPLLVPFTRAKEFSSKRSTKVDNPSN